MRFSVLCDLRALLFIFVPSVICKRLPPSELILLRNKLPRSDIATQKTTALGTSSSPARVPQLLLNPHSFFHLSLSIHHLSFPSQSGPYGPDRQEHAR